MKCRFCDHVLQHLFVDLGMAPPSNAYILPEHKDKEEKKFPLQVYVCHHCWLVQTKDFVDADALFSSDYAYFSSVSCGWLTHAEQFASMIIEKLRLTQTSLVIEIASNDGYLLKNFVAANIPCLGIEPTIETSEVAKKLNIPVLNDFFTEQLGKDLVAKGQQADLIVGNNVLAHVPDIKDFVSGLKLVLARSGTVTMEFPHLMELIENNQFDTIYHEHFSYLSLNIVCDIFEYAGLRIFDVETLTTHGGSLRIYACHKSDKRKKTAELANVLRTEIKRGLQNLDTYLQFQSILSKIKQQLIDFLALQKEKGKSVLGYGAAAKGNTLLNYAGITPELLPVICDAAPSKQHKLMPGSHIPIYPPDYLNTATPDYLLVLPWNIKDEIKQQLAFLENTKIVIAIPYLAIDE